MYSFASDYNTYSFNITYKKQITSDPNKETKYIISYRSKVEAAHLFSNSTSQTNMSIDKSIKNISIPIKTPAITGLRQ